MEPEKLSPAVRRLRALSLLGKRAFISFLVVLLGLACSQVSAGAGRKNQPLAIEVLFDKESYASADPILISFKLVNVSEKPLWVNTRAYLSSPDLSERQREVTLKVVGPSEKKLPCKYGYFNGFPNSDYFLKMEPGQEVVSDNSRHLKGYYDLEGPGTYTVTATYANSYGEELGLDVFKGPVISEPATFTIDGESAP